MTDGIEVEDLPQFPTRSELMGKHQSQGRSTTFPPLRRPQKGGWGESDPAVAALESPGNDSRNGKERGYKGFKEVLPRSEAVAAKIVCIFMYL